MNWTNIRSSQLSQASWTPDLLYWLVSSTLFLSSFPISHLIIHDSTIITEHKVNSSLSITSCHDYELISTIVCTEYNIHRLQHTPSTTYTEHNIQRVHHTLSIAYTKYTICQVQHTLCTTSTQHCLASHYSHTYEMTPEYSFSFPFAPYVMALMIRFSPMARDLSRAG